MIASSNGWGNQWRPAAPSRIPRQRTSARRPRKRPWLAISARGRMIRHDCCVNAWLPAERLVSGTVLDIGAGLGLLSLELLKMGGRSRNRSRRGGGVYRDGAA